MAGKKQGKLNRGREGAAEAVTTAVELNATGTGASVVQSLELSDPPSTPDTGTPLPDDPKVLKESVKGLKSQLRRHKRQVLLTFLRLHVRLMPRRSRMTGLCFSRGDSYSHWESSVASCLLSPCKPISEDDACTIFAVGILSASWFIPPSTLPALPALPEHLQILLDEYEFAIPTIPTLDFSAEWQRFKSNIPEPWKLANDGREFLVGEEMKSRGLEAKYPVVLIPGIISTASFPYTPVVG